MYLTTNVLMNESTFKTIHSLALVFCTLYKRVPKEDTDRDYDSCTTAVWAHHEGAVSGLGFRPSGPKVYR